VVYDAVSESGAADAFQEVYGKRALPNYHLDKAEVIVSFEADFLGDFHGGFEKAYVAGRKPENGKMSYHVQLESNMSLTGANADKRMVVKPSDQVFALLNLYNALSGNNVASKATAQDAAIKKLAATLQKAGSKAVVLTGLNDKNAQLITLEINRILGSEIIDVTNTLNIRQGNDADVAQMVADLKSGTLAGVVSYNVDPVYSLANGQEFATALKDKLSVAIAVENNDTVAASNYVLPATHFLESWGDVSISEGNYSLVQPTIQKLFKTRQIQEVLLAWSGSSTSYYDYLKSFWSSNVLGGASWNTALHNGFFTKEVSKTVALKSVSLSEATANLYRSVKASEFELVLYTSTGLGDGKQANNPWLQEFPDPLTRASWDNYLTISMADAKKLGFTNPIKDNGAIDGDYANLTLNGVTVANVPVLIQPGQAPGSIGLALGYGRTLGFKDEMKVGVNAYPLYKDANTVQYGVAIEKVSGTHRFACTQVTKNNCRTSRYLKRSFFKRLCEYRSKRS